MNISINNSEWIIRFVSPRNPILYIGNGEHTYGVTVPSHRAIYIADNIRGDLFHHVLVHELFHAEMAARGLNLPIYIEECLCDLVADHELETINIARNVHNNLCKYYGRC
ncbi:MAG: hypothetical protein Q4D29_10150 [Lachnospiraceae bacterium]|nr:hypothetical protein [Lachnospiraceae bacterium]